MKFQFLQKRQEEAEAISNATKAFSGIQISDDAGINNTITALKKEGYSSFAIREALKTSGVLDFED